MPSRTNQTIAYVLHTRAYRETSLLVELLSLDYGRISVVARGAKRGPSKNSSILQPFILLQISWYGSGDLVTLTMVEELQPASRLLGKSLVCGLYVNELLMKLVPKWDECREIFNSYQQVIIHLENDIQDTQIENGAQNIQIILRKFEKQLLQFLGYALQLTVEAQSKLPVLADSYYRFDPVLGPILSNVDDSIAISGATLLVFAQDGFLDKDMLLNKDMLRDIKRLMRWVLDYHLGGRKIVSRELLSK